MTRMPCMLLRNCEMYISCLSPLLLIHPCQLMGVMSAYSLRRTKDQKGADGLPILQVCKA